MLDTNALYSKNDAELVHKRTCEVVTNDYPDDHILPSFYLSDITVEERAFQIAQTTERAFNNARTVRALAPGLVWPLIADVLRASRQRFDDLIQDLRLTVRRLDTGQVNWDSMITRALLRQPPFEESGTADVKEGEKPREKGFRDALMLEAFDQLCAETPDEQAALIIVTSDKRAGEAVKQLTDARITLLVDIAALESYLNELVSDLTKAQADKIQAAVATLLKGPANQLSAALLAIKKEIAHRFGDKLAEIDIGYAVRKEESFGWDDPIFIRLADATVFWSISVTFNSTLKAVHPFSAPRVNRNIFNVRPEFSNMVGFPIPLVDQGGSVWMGKHNLYELPDAYRRDEFVVKFRTNISADLNELSDFQITEIDFLGSAVIPPRTLNMIE